jgi:hypothetical protein
MVNRDWLVPGHVLGDWVPNVGDVVERHISCGYLFPHDTSWRREVDVFLGRCEQQGVTVKLIRCFLRVSSRLRGAYDLTARVKVLGVRALMNEATLMRKLIEAEQRSLRRLGAGAKHTPRGRVQSPQAPR